LVCGSEVVVSTPSKPFADPADLLVAAEHLTALLRELEVDVPFPVMAALRSVERACELSPRRARVFPEFDGMVIPRIPLDEARALCGAARVGMCASALSLERRLGDVDVRLTGRALWLMAGAVDASVATADAWRRAAVVRAAESAAWRAAA
jgi:hypothetical protein